MSGIFEKIGDLFRESQENKTEAPQPPSPPALEEVRDRIYNLNRSMELETRKASLCETKAQELFTKTFQVGMSPIERKRLLEESKKKREEAKRRFQYAGQYAKTLETLEMSETIMTLSATFAASEFANSANFSFDGLVKDLEKSERALRKYKEEIEEFNQQITVSFEMFDGMTNSRSENAEIDELSRLYDAFDQESDPIKKTEIMNQIRAKTGMQELA